MPQNPEPDHFSKLLASVCRYESQIVFHTHHKPPCDPEGGCLPEWFRNIAKRQHQRSVGRHRNHFSKVIIEARSQGGTQLQAAYTAYNKMTSIAVGMKISAPRNPHRSYGSTRSLDINPLRRFVVPQNRMMAHVLRKYQEWTWEFCVPGTRERNGAHKWEISLLSEAPVPKDRGLGIPELSFNLAAWQRTTGVLLFDSIHSIPLRHVPLLTTGLGSRHHENALSVTCDCFQYDAAQVEDTVKAPLRRGARKDITWCAACPPVTFLTFTWCTSAIVDASEVGDI
jgi:hypothetical protein